MSEDDNPKKPYTVGYGKPPKSGQFTSGTSGNPKGRPKGAKNVKTLVNKVMGERIEITEAGETKKMPKVEVLVRKTFAFAMKGDATARTYLFSLIEAEETLEEDLGSLAAIELADIREFAARTAKETSDLADVRDCAADTGHGGDEPNAADENDQDENDQDDDDENEGD